MRCFDFGPITVTALIFTAGCTLDDGTGFATLEDSALRARFEPTASGNLGGGRVLTDLGYEVLVTQASLGVDSVDLEQTNPTAAETPSFEPVVSMPVGKPLDLLSAERVSLNRFEPSKELPQATLSRLALLGPRLTLSGEVAKGPPTGGFGAATAPLHVDLALPQALEAEIALVIDRDEPGVFSVSVDWRATEALFAGIDFAQSVTAGQVEIVTPASSAGAMLAASTARSELTLTVH